MIEVKICVGTNCSFKGSLDILEYLENDASLKGKIKIIEAKCFNKACKPNKSPVVMIDDELIVNVNLSTVINRIQEKLKVNK